MCVCVFLLCYPELVEVVVGAHGGALLLLELSGVLRHRVVRLLDGAPVHHQLVHAEGVLRENLKRAQVRQPLSQPLVLPRVLERVRQLRQLRGGVRAVRINEMK
eukprot:1188306-Prorocentrum_minimum.AAC.9